MLTGGRITWEIFVDYQLPFEYLPIDSLLIRSDLGKQQQHVIDLFDYCIESKITTDD